MGKYKVIGRGQLVSKRGQLELAPFQFELAPREHALGRRSWARLTLGSVVAWWLGGLEVIVAAKSLLSRCLVAVYCFG